ncbi:MAG: hypothetical protein AAF658_07730 [Myxococcota bacterium]
MLIATALFALALTPGFVLVEDNVVVEDDATVQLTRLIGSDSADSVFRQLMRVLDDTTRRRLDNGASGEIQRLCDWYTETGQYTTCEWQDKILTVTQTYRTGPRSPVEMQGMSDRAYEFDLLRYLDAAPPVGNRNVPAVHTLRLSMPGRWIHRFGCFVKDPDTPVVVKINAAEHQPPACASMPKKTTLPPPVSHGYLYEGEVTDFTYKDRPIRKVVSELTRSWIPWVTFGGTATLVLLLVVIVVPKYLSAITPKRKRVKAQRF